MEDFCQRFPHLKEKIIKKLDSKTLANSNQSSRKLNLTEGKIWWIRIIQKYIGDEKYIQKAWEEVGLCVFWPAEIVPRFWAAKGGHAPVP